MPHLSVIRLELKQRMRSLVTVAFGEEIFQSLYNAIAPYVINYANPMGVANLNPLSWRVFSPGRTRAGCLFMTPANHFHEEANLFWGHNNCLGVISIDFIVVCPRQCYAMVEYSILPENRQWKCKSVSSHDTCKSPTKGAGVRVSFWGCNNCLGVISIAVLISTWWIGNLRPDIWGEREV